MQLVGAFSAFGTGNPIIVLWLNVLNVFVEGVLISLVYLTTESTSEGFSTPFSYIAHGISAAISVLLAFTLMSAKPAAEDAEPLPAPVDKQAAPADEEPAL